MFVFLRLASDKDLKNYFMKKNFFVAFIFCAGVMLLLVSCKQQAAPLQPAKPLPVDVTRIAHSMIMDSTVIASVTPLETKIETLIGHIDKMLIREGRMYLLDKEGAKSLFVFDTSGKFIYKINRVGQGPGEYIEPDDFTVNDKAGEVIIWDIDQKKALFFKDNVFLREKRVAEPISFIAYAPGIIAGSNEYCKEMKDCYHLFLYDEDFNLIKREVFFESNPGCVEWDLHLPFFVAKEKIYYNQAFFYTIKSIDKDKVTPFVNIDFGAAYRLDTELLKKPRAEFLAYLGKENGKAYLIDDFMLNDSLLCFTFVYNTIRASAFVLSRDPKQYRLTKGIALFDNSIYFNPIYMDEAYIYTFADAALLRKYRGLKADKQEQNPVLIKVSVSKFLHFLGLDKSV